MQPIVLGKVSGHDANDITAVIAGSVIDLSAQPPSAQSPAEMSSLPSTSNSAEVQEKPLQEAAAALSAKQVNKDGLSQVMKNNRAWASSVIEQDATYFDRLCELHAPDYMWIGCADARVPANIIMGLDAGEVFTQRNVGNQACHTDLNCMSCLEYAVKVLKVKQIIVCGHYGCGAVKASLSMPSGTQGLVNCWISDIRNCRNEHAAELKALGTGAAQTDRLCELNVLRQTFNVCTSPVVQEAWANGVELSVLGLVYALKDGLLRNIVGPLSKDSDFTPQGFEDCASCSRPYSETPSVSGGGASFDVNGFVSERTSPRQHRRSSNNSLITARALRRSSSGVSAKVVDASKNPLAPTGSVTQLQSVHDDEGDSADEDDEAHVEAADNTFFVAQQIGEHVSWSAAPAPPVSTAPLAQPFVHFRSAAAAKAIPVSAAGHRALVPGSS
ncbi:MAG: hypothetical protein WDW38_002351 [Sanguina aurantia]